MNELNVFVSVGGRDRWRLEAYSSMECASYLGGTHGRRFRFGRKVVRWLADA